jgi:putative FmdB family regulatory protein
MPTYDYECGTCGHRFEVFEKIHAEGRKPCPKCKKGKAKRMLGAGAGFIFKGSGFYTTDYKKSPAASEPAKKKTARKKTEGPKSESKE